MCRRYPPPGRDNVKYPWIVGLVWCCAAIQWSVASVTSGIAGPSKEAITQYFNDQTSRTSESTRGRKHIVEISTDYGLRAVYEGASERTTNAVYDALFLLKYFVDVDVTDTARFRKNYAGRLDAILSSDPKCKAVDDDLKRAVCVIKNISSTHQVRFYFVRTDEGFECSTPLRPSDFMPDRSREQCIRVRKARN
jgi:hypothetical protein